MKTLKQYLNNSDVIILIIISIIFWWFRFQGIFYSQVFTDIFGFWDWFSTIMYVLIAFGVGGAIPIYLIINFTKFKRTGKR